MSNIINQHEDMYGNKLVNGDFVVDVDDYQLGGLMVLYRVTDASPSEVARISISRQKIINPSKIEVLNELEDILDGWTDTNILVKMPLELVEQGPEAVSAAIRLFGKELVEGDFDYEALNKE